MPLAGQLDVVPRCQRPIWIILAAISSGYATSRGTTWQLRTSALMLPMTAMGLPVGGGRFRRRGAAHTLTVRGGATDLNMLVSRLGLGRRSW
jgi:hypothetical protein